MVWMRLPSRIWKPDIRIINNPLFLEPWLPSWGFSDLLVEDLLWKEAWTLCEVAASWFLTGSLWSNDLLTYTSWKQHLFVWCFLLFTKAYSFRICSVQIYSKVCKTGHIKPSKSAGDTESLYPPRWMNQTVKAGLCLHLKNAFHFHHSQGSTCAC